uniref:NADH dehydrogenase subunit 2 n=1 Tax=Symphoromyia crassicornis TaxID=1842026 RepID=UPI0020298D4F|nr:NADH dehydrogenase subunit 2 [Symphoromyia crassicornis]UQU69093.1 NADH dehydrogenase subunit 2 [Symphoromyia crassicornis]
MFKNSSKILFLMTLMMGTMISISSNSWMGAWMGLEINLLSFIPLMSDNNNLMSTEASLKYFLTQALASAILLFSVILLSMKMYTIFQININHNYANLMIMTSLFMKSGAAPFHFWFPGVMEGLSWINNLILMTWQKIAPMMLISYINEMNFMISVIILSVLIGSLGGLNQTSLRKIMAFSSINHLGWMLSAMMFNENLWLFYFLIYMFLSITIILFFNLFKLFHINQVFSLNFSNKMIKFVLMINLLSLGGLPPFLGFLPKWMVIQNLTMMNQITIMTLMTIMTLITLYFYLRICYSAFMLNYYENNWMTVSYSMNKTMYIYLIFSFFSIFGLFMISLIYFIM